MEVMWKNYFVTAWRNLLKNKLYSLVNITGLATGMAVAMIIAQTHGFGLCNHNDIGRDLRADRAEKIKSVVVSNKILGELAVDHK